jgi:hypothetical protein
MRDLDLPKGAHTSDTDMTLRRRASICRWAGRAPTTRLTSRRKSMSQVGVVRSPRNIIEALSGDELAGNSVVEPNLPAGAAPSDYQHSGMVAGDAPDESPPAPTRGVEFPGSSPAVDHQFLSQVFPIARAEPRT